MIASDKKIINRVGRSSTKEPTTVIKQNLEKQQEYELSGVWAVKQSFSICQVMVLMITSTASKE